MPQLVIVDSGSANLSSVYKAVKAIGLEPLVSDTPGEIGAADAVIFPGVGSFGHAAAKIEEKALTETLLSVIAADRPFLGICLGMQLLFPESEEQTPCNEKAAAGLGALPGKVRRFPEGLPIPHVGWNAVTPLSGRKGVPANLLFSNLEKEAYFYYTHSFYVEPALDGDLLATTDYGFPFAAAVNRGNLFGVQFHPEKSGAAGLQLLSNFGKIIAGQS